MNNLVSATLSGSALGLGVLGHICEGGHTAMHCEAGFRPHLYVPALPRHEAVELGCIAADWKMGAGYF